MTTNNAAKNYIAGKYNLLGKLEKERDYLRIEAKQLNDALFANQELIAKTVQQIEHAENPNFTITADSIKAESYYNICRISHLTKYADPIAALRASGEMIEVTRDADGNILTAEVVE